MSTPLAIELPWPPSVNTYWRHVVMGRAVRVLISKRGRDYRNLVGQRCMLERVHGRRLAGRLGVLIEVFPPDRRKRDLDNLPKGVLDSLVHAGVFLDDSQVDALHVLRHPITPGGKVRVTITEIQHPEPAQMEIHA